MRSDDERFAHLVGALRPWLDRLVFVGGWAHRLHRSVPGLDAPPYPPLMTRDVDLAFAPRTGMTGDIKAALDAHGFRERLGSEHRPPIASYHLAEDPSFFAEFLVPLSGSGVRRDGTPDATLTEAGVSAQKLRHLDLLLHAPYVLDLRAGGSVPVTAPATIRVPNPASFIAQKLLIAETRPPDKRASISCTCTTRSSSSRIDSSTCGPSGAPASLRSWRSGRSTPSRIAPRANTAR